MVLNIEQNSLILADCLDLLKEWYKNGRRNFIDHIYIDPPFNSNRNYNVIFGSEFNLSEQAFKDIWSNISYLDELENINEISPKLFNFIKMLENTGLPKSYLSYLTKMSIRCWYMREMLKDTGSFYFHCDPIMTHYIKIILDYIFDVKNFRNEIIWKSVSNISGPKSRTKFKFPRSHDNILFYTKSNKFKINKQYIPLTKENIETNFRENDNDGKGRYSWQPIRYKITEERKQELIRKNEFWAAGDRNKSKYHGYKHYLSNAKGSPIGDLWTDIKPLSTGQNNEHEGLDTQKPEKLLERIILASSNEGDVVADFFLGMGTTIAVADRLNRKWIGVDINLRAIQLTQGRLEKVKKYHKKDYIIEGIPNSAKALRSMVDQNILGKEKDSKFALEDITVKYYLHNVVGNENKRGDKSIDGRFGFDYKGKKRTGLVQITAGANINHFSSFCLVVKSDEEKADLGVYISFENRIPKSWYIKAKQQGKIGNVDRVQILTFEDLIDNRQQFQKPSEVLTV